MKKFNKNIILFPFLILFFTDFCSAQNNQLKQNIENNLLTLQSADNDTQTTQMPELKQAQRFIYTQFIQSGIETKVLDNNHNILGIIPSKTNDYILIKSHFYNNNAINKQIKNINQNTGTASLIEVANLLQNQDLKYGVIFLAIEDSLVSTFNPRSFYKSIENKNIVLVLNIDSIGYFNKNNYVTFEGFSTFADGENIIQKSKIPELTIKTTPTSKNSSFYNDSIYFANKTIPEINITVENDTYFYQNENDINSIDIPGIALITENIVSLVQNLPNPIISQNINLFQDTEQRYGFTFGKLFFNAYDEEKYYLPDSKEFINISTFILLPLEKVNIGNCFIRPELSLFISPNDVSGQTKTIFNFDLSLVEAFKLKNVELLFPLGAYYSFYFDDYKNLNNEIGLFFNFDVKSYSSYNFVNSLQFGFDFRYGLQTQKLFKHNTSNISKTKAAGFHCSLIF